MLTLETALAATQGRLEGANAPLNFTTVATDSRAVPAGSLFVCLKGPNFDGHAFAEQAVAAGAAAVVAQEGFSGALGVPVIRVEDTLAALGLLAREWRRAWGGKVVAITGSSGKTSTKEMVAAYFALGLPVLKTEGNQNNEIGVPLTLFRLTPDHAVAIVEMGMRAQGEIAYLTKIAEPDVGIITNIGVAHLGRLGSQEAIASAKAELWRNLPAGGTAVVPFDDPLAAREAGSWGGRTVSFSLDDPAATVWASDVHPLGDGQVFTAYWKAGKTFKAGRAEIQVPLWGDHHRANALAAIAAGWALGWVPAPSLTIEPTQLAGRMVIHDAAGVTLVDDTYNANPESMRAALKAFAETPARGRRFAVLGDMGELGEQAEALHREVGAFAAALPLDGLAAVGQFAGRYAEGYPDARTFDTSEAACAFLAERLRPGDRVFFKASRAARLEGLVACVKTQLGT